MDDGAESFAMKKLRHIRRTNRNLEVPKEKRKLPSKTPPKCQYVDAKISHLQTSDPTCWEASHRPARMLSEKDSRILLERAGNETPQLIVLHGDRSCKTRKAGNSPLMDSGDYCVSSRLMNRIVLKNLTVYLPGMAGLDDVRSEFPEINTGRGRMSATADRSVLRETPLTLVCITVHTRHVSFLATHHACSRKTCGHAALPVSHTDVHIIGFYFL
jgi:hypothetical protein